MIELDSCRKMLKEVDEGNTRTQQIMKRQAVSAPADVEKKNKKTKNKKKKQKKQNNNDKKKKKTTGDFITKTRLYSFDPS